MSDHLGKAAAAALAAVVGLVVGWAGTALTLTGRVSAIEATLTRIEARLYPAAVQQEAAK